MERRRSCLFRVATAILCLLTVAGLSIILWLVIDQPYCPVLDAPVTSSPGSSTCVIGDQSEINWHNISLQFDGATGGLTVTRFEEPVLEAEVANFSAQCSNSISKTLNCSHTDDELCVKSTSEDILRIKPERQDRFDMACLKVIHSSAGDKIAHCFSYGDAHWYGAAEVHDQLWPIEKWDMDYQEFVVGDPYFPGVFGSVQERYWLSSHGSALYVPFHVPLFVSMNRSGDGQLCLASQVKNSAYRVTDDNSKPLELSYYLCQAADVTTVHKHMVGRFWSKPTARPNLEAMMKPIWSTWALYKKDINETYVREFADRILSNNLSISQLEIDDDWTPFYGDWTFNLDKFPSAQQMIEELKTRIPAVTVWIHPFINADSQSFASTAANHLLMEISDIGPAVPGLTGWWNPGYAGLLDFSSNETKAWFLAKMDRLKSDYGVSSFKFDAGEVKWMPQHTEMAASYGNPSEYIRHYVETTVKADDTLRQEVRVGCRTQSSPILVRMMDRRSRWGTDNGLKTVIPTALTFSLIGYPFVLPDMIGGNAYDGAVVERELFVRWLQVNIFLPAIQFSIPPWHFDDDQVVDHTREMLALRESYRWLFDHLTVEAVSKGWPIVRPLWWSHPRDPQSLVIDDQFMLGDELLVAPVVDSGKVTRDVYLPPGLWLDKCTGTNLTGGRWYRNYDATLFQLPYFEKL